MLLSCALHVTFHWFEKSEGSLVIPQNWDARDVKKSSKQVILIMFQPFL